MCMLDTKFQKKWCRTFYMEKTGVSELTLYSQWEQFTLTGLCLQKVLCGSGSPTPKASLHLAQFRVSQVAAWSLTVCFGFETSKLYPKGDFPQMTARSNPSLLVTKWTPNIWILLSGISWVEKTGPNPTFLVENCSQLHCRENYWSQPATPHSAGKVPFGRGRLIHLQDNLTLAFLLHFWASMSGTIPAAVHASVTCHSPHTHCSGFGWLLPLLTPSLQNPLVVQRQKHRGYTELLLSSQTFKQVNVPGETVDSLGQTAASQGFQEHNHPSGAASHNFNVLLLSTDILCYFSGHVKLLQKLLATADLCITISTITYLYIVSHTTLPRKAFPV